MEGAGAVSDHHEQHRLEDVLDAFVASTVWPTSTHLDEWIGRFPEYAPELTRCATNWRLMRAATVASDETESPDDVLVHRGKEIVGKLLAADAQVANIGSAARRPPM